MAIPISYNIRNLKLRKGLTLMTALGIALTVTTAIFLMALVAGLNRAFVTQRQSQERAGAAQRIGSGVVRRLRCVAVPHAQDPARHRQGQQGRADGFRANG